MESVKSIKFDRFIVDKPFFDNNPQRSTTNNVHYRKVLMMVFKDWQGKEYIFMPKWADVINLNTQSVEVELMNKRLYREQNIEVQ